ncbi:hypothetical protein DL768_007284 [Monosporascus sp. mg162]|nr:hypothetical protein DL768_007284 [Monosporascus sp. mg162]
MADENKPERACNIARTDLGWLTNILPDSTAAPSLQEKQEEISHRPSPEKLMNEGVLYGDPQSPEEKYAEAVEDEYTKREGDA